MSYTFGKSHPIQRLPRPQTDMEKKNSLVLSEKTSVKKDMTCKYSHSFNSRRTQINYREINIAVVILASQNTSGTTKHMTVTSRGKTLSRQRRHDCGFGWNF